MSNLVLDRSIPITPSLDALTAGPSHRGYVENCVEGVVTGWCISTENPVAPVELEIYIGEVLIGVTLTDTSRPDISKALGFPVKAAFRFGFCDAESTSLFRAISILSEVASGESAPEKSFSIRVRDSGQSLPLAPELRVGAQVLDRLSGLLDQTVTTSIDDLDTGPSHRGTVDQLSDGVLIGWCIKAKDLGRPVELDVYIGDVLVGTTETTTVRADVSEALRLPVISGFQFALKNCNSAVLSNAIQALNEAINDPLNLKLLFSVRVRENECLLPIFPEVCFTKSDAQALARALNRRLRSLQRNRAIRDRDALLVVTPASTPKNQEDVKLVAFYLPQFHPFPENSEWWGEGFTEWTNVSGARPSFTHHYQPRMPADLGYYDLRLDEVQVKQVDLAKKYGVAAFCYHYYWFSGTTLMTLPIDRHVRDNYDLDFCLCWANENWSRRWDGSENDVLITQQHTEADDIAFIHSVLPYFKHPRYIRLDGAPLLVVYRISLLSNPQRVVEQWKRIVREAGYPDLHVSMAETFGLENPNEFGVDSSCQFPPHGVTAQERNKDIDGLEPRFVGKIYDYVEVAASEIRRMDPGHLRFRTVMPSWDNTSRKGTAGHVFHNATPEVFEAWLSQVIAKTRREYPPGYRYVFINAWNEWAEGAYLEPDRRNGHGNLRAVRNALSVQNSVLGEALLPSGVEGDDEFRRKVMRVVSTLSNANRQLLRFVSEYVRPDGAPSAFIALPENAIRRVIARTDGRLQIDRVNGRTAGPTEITIRRQQALSLNGWLHIPDVPQTEQRPLFIRLSPFREHSGAVEYVASVYSRIQRPDVAAVFGDYDGTNFHGYWFTGDLERVEPGSYRIGAMLASDTDSRAAFAVHADLVIHVG